MSWTYQLAADEWVYQLAVSEVETDNLLLMEDGEELLTEDGTGLELED